jgi:hypothetical protein
MLARIALVLGRKKDGSWAVIKTADKPTELLGEADKAVASGDFVYAGIARNVRITRTRRNKDAKVAPTKKEKTKKPKTEKKTAAPKAPKKVKEPAPKEPEKKEPESPPEE